VRRLAELGHVVPLLLRPLHQLVVHGLVHVRLPAQDLQRRTNKQAPIDACQTHRESGRKARQGKAN
jgi:hypothetical protein